jgi:predicted O-methyltransferase YrrM
VDVETRSGVRDNLDRAGASTIVETVIADGGEHLRGLPDASVDLLFLDAERVEYVGWWPHPIRVLRPGGVLAVDNVLSHPDEVAEFLELVDAVPGVTSTTVAVGKGLFLAWLPTASAAPRVARRHTTAQRGRQRRVDGYRRWR